MSEIPYQQRASAMSRLEEISMRGPIGRIIGSITRKKLEITIAEIDQMPDDQYFGRSELQPAPVEVRDDSPITAVAVPEKPEIFPWNEWGNDEYVGS